MQTTSITSITNFIFENSEVYEIKIDTTKKPLLFSLQGSSTNDSIYIKNIINVTTLSSSISTSDQVKSNINESS